MFRILEGRNRPRALSPMTIGVSVAAHFLVLCGVVYAAADRPDPPVLTGIIDIREFPRPTERQVPPEPTRAVEPAQPAERPLSDATPRPRLDVPVTVPTDIPLPDPNDLPVTVGDLEPRGPVGPPTGPVGDPNPGGSDPGPFGPVGDYIPTADDVDERPQVDREGLARILGRYYPRSLQDARVTGRVLVEMIVDEEGQVVDGSARVLETSHPAFAAATLRAVER